MAISFLAKIKEMAISEFKFTSFTKMVSSPDDNGDKMIYLVFELADPIAKVVGSQTLYSPNDDQRVNPVMTDVMTLKCSLRVMEASESEWTFDENNGELTGSGEYKGDLIFDISSKDEVWLTDVKFSKFGLDRKNQKRNERFARFLEQASKK